MLDLDPDDGAAHDRRDLVAGPPAAAAEFGVQPVPGEHAHGAVAGVGRGQFVVGVGPAGRVGAAEPGAVAAGSTDGAGCGCDRVGVEDPVVTDADHDRCAEIGQRVGERDGVVAGVEDEHRHRAGAVIGGGEAGDQLSWVIH